MTYEVMYHFDSCALALKFQIPTPYLIQKLENQITFSSFQHIFVENLSDARKSSGCLGYINPLWTAEVVEDKKKKKNSSLEFSIKQSL